MKKEIIIIIVVVILIVALNIYTSKNTNRVMDEIVAYLNLAKEGIELEADEQIEENMQMAKDTWDKEKDKLSVYIEHDELEKIELYMTNVNTNVKSKEYHMAMEALDSCDFIIDHIRDKYSLSIKNIF